MKAYKYLNYICMLKLFRNYVRLTYSPCEYHVFSSSSNLDKVLPHIQTEREYMMKDGTVSHS